MWRILCVALGLTLCAGGCGKDIQEIADQHVRADMLDKQYVAHRPQQAQHQIC